MNRIQKLIGARAGLIKDVIYMILNDEYAMIGGFDYSENSLYRLCRNKLSESLKINKYSINDIKDMNCELYVPLMKPLCVDIANSYHNKFK